MSNLVKTKTFSVKNLTKVALFTAILCVVSPFSIPFGVVPISLSSLAVFLACVVLGGVKATVAVTVYVLIGAIGLPVFSSFSSGFGALFGATGGFILGYIPCALVTGVVLNAIGDKKLLYFSAFTIGTLILYFCGTLYYVLVYKVGVDVALITCVLPFILVDVIKIIIATILTVILKPKLKYIKKGVS